MTTTQRPSHLALDVVVVDGQRHHRSEGALHRGLTPTQLLPRGVVLAPLPPLSTADAAVHVTGRRELNSYPLSASQQG
jgi:hypothetical protein